MRRPRSGGKTADLISDQLRAALLAGGDSIYQTAAAAGCPRSSLSRFLAGRRSLSLATVDRVAAQLGLRLVPTGRRPR